MLEVQHGPSPTDAVTAWNDQMALLPWGLSRILGITTHLGVPEALPLWVAATGAALMLGGTALTLRPGRAAGACWRGA
ncbi:hypothetical protein [Actinomadura sp. WMMB 499]|uniref:hypothetical protein n=1 Tax=Actinomadura sp. WMMB 499 TaxID=1219491 RepID=UPI00124754F6|nr:hypothetical protein [Actinomadura sp. WMMB 499]QFG22816.1 hypothetical protein F7P10_18525 [Actinomadura sp. WMMB 499]